MPYPDALMRKSDVSLRYRFRASPRWQLTAEERGNGQFTIEAKDVALDQVVLLRCAALTVTADQGSIR
jgi:hypothetical protein